eukprot:tig00021319_g20214.t1
MTGAAREGVATRFLLEDASPPALQVAEIVFRRALELFPYSAAARVSYAAFKLKYDESPQAGYALFAEAGRWAGPRRRVPSMQATGVGAGGRRRGEEGDELISLLEFQARPPARRPRPGPASSGPSSSPRRRARPRPAPGGAGVRAGPGRQGPGGQAPEQPRILRSYGPHPRPASARAPGAGAGEQPAEGGGRQLTGRAAKFHEEAEDLYDAADEFEESAATQCAPPRPARPAPGSAPGGAVEEEAGRGRATGRAARGRPASRRPPTAPARLRPRPAPPRRAQLTSNTARSGAPPGRAQRDGRGKPRPRLHLPARRVNIGGVETRSVGPAGELLGSPAAGAASGACARRGEAGRPSAGALTDVSEVMPFQTLPAAPAPEAPAVRRLSAVFAGPGRGGERGGGAAVGGERGAASSAGATGLTGGFALSVAPSVSPSLAGLAHPAAPAAASAGDDADGGPDLTFPEVFGLPLARVRPGPRPPPRGAGGGRGLRGRRAGRGPGGGGGALGVAPGEQAALAYGLASAGAERFPAFVSLGGALRVGRETVVRLVVRRADGGAGAPGGARSRWGRRGAALERAGGGGGGGALPRGGPPRRPPRPPPAPAAPAPAEGPKERRASVGRRRAGAGVAQQLGGGVIVEAAAGAPRAAPGGESGASTEREAAEGKAGAGGPGEEEEEGVPDEAATVGKKSRWMRKLNALKRRAAAAANNDSGIRRMRWTVRVVVLMLLLCCPAIAVVVESLVGLYTRGLERVGESSRRIYESSSAPTYARILAGLPGWGADGAMEGHARETLAELLDQLKDVDRGGGLRVARVLDDAGRLREAQTSAWDAAGRGGPGGAFGEGSRLHGGVGCRLAAEGGAGPAQLVDAGREVLRYASAEALRRAFPDPEHNPHFAFLIKNGATTVMEAFEAATNGEDHHAHGYFLAIQRAPPRPAPPRPAPRAPG